MNKSSAVILLKVLILMVVAGTCFIACDDENGGTGTEPGNGNNGDNGDNGDNGKSRILVCDENWTHRDGSTTNGPTCSGPGYSFTLILLSSSECQPVPSGGHIDGNVKDNYGGNNYFTLDEREITIDVDYSYEAEVTWENSWYEGGRWYAAGEFKLYEYN